MKNKILLSLVALTVLTGGLYAQANDSLTVVNAKWNTKHICPGVEWRSYHFKDNEKIFGAPEYVNILIIDQKSGKRFTFAATKGQLVRTSDAARAAGAIAAINGCFYNTRAPYNSVCTLKIDGEVHAWAGDGNYIIIDKNGRLRLVSNTDITGWTDPTIMGMWPFLLENGKNLVSTLPSQRHPHTAIGTAGDKVMFITVDGRKSKNSQGMSFNELAQLLKWIGVENALNLDGGGSTTMYIRGEGKNGIVNHPSDNWFGFDHSGERSVGNSILLLDNNATSTL